MTTTVPDLAGLSSSIETRDATGLLAWYADDAILTVIDRDHSPSAPTVYTGSEAIGEYYRDVCGRNIEHSVRDAVATPDGLAYVQHCQYPDGTRVVCATIAVVQNGKISRQTAVQAWDDAGA